MGGPVSKDPLIYLLDVIENITPQSAVSMAKLRTITKQGNVLIAII